MLSLPLFRLDLGAVSGGGGGAAAVLSGSAVAENASLSTVIGTLSVLNGTGSYTFSITADPDNKFALSGDDLINDGTFNYEAATSHSVTIEADNGVDDPVSRTFTIIVTNVYEAANLSALSLDDTDIPEDASATVNITGATSGSTITLLSGSLPTGMTLNSGARTISGTPTTAGESTFTLRETLADSANSPRDTALSLTVSAAVVITTPVLGDAAVPNIAGDWRPVYEIDFVDAYPTGGGIGDVVQLRWGESEAEAELATPEEATVSEDWFIDGFEPFPGLGDYGATLTPPTDLVFQGRIKRGSNYSAWSNFHTLAIADGVMTAPGWTDLTEQTGGERVWSSGETVAGMASGAYARLLGTGPLKVGSTVYEAGDEVQVQNGDTLYAGVDTSSTPEATVDNVVSNRGVALETFSAQTEGAAPSLPQSGSLAVHYDISDLAMLWQTNTGTTAVASDGDVVGTWKDWTANVRDLTSAANDTTRPVYRTGGGYPYLEFDGSNDILRWLGDLGLWNASGYTAAIAFHSANNAANKTLLGCGNTGSSNQVISIAHSVLANADNATGWIRNNSGVDVLGSSVDITTGFDEADRVLIIVDNGSSVQMYLDGTAGTARNYTRGSNSLTLNTFSIGGLLRNTAGLFFATRIHGVAVWPGINLDSTDRATVTTAFGALQGRTL